MSGSLLKDDKNDLIGLKEKQNKYEIRIMKK
jgi:hypothetical protein